MNGNLTRYESTSAGTFGILTVDNITLHTVERPWLNNKPFESCIPPGYYNIHPFTRSNGDEVYALSGNSVSIYKEDGFKRYTVLIHVGNYMKDVVGCIAPGLIRHGDMVQKSRIAMDTLMDVDLTSLTIQFGEI